MHCQEREARQYNTYAYICYRADTIHGPIEPQKRTSVSLSKGDSHTIVLIRAASQKTAGVSRYGEKSDSSKSPDNLSSREAKKTRQAFRHGFLQVLLFGVGIRTKNGTTAWNETAK